jgi:hypothetical protein
MSLSSKFVHQTEKKSKMKLELCRGVPLYAISVLLYNRNPILRQYATVGLKTQKREIVTAKEKLTTLCHQSLPWEEKNEIENEG